MPLSGNFFHRHKRLLLFGFLLNFFSCFGQTIIVSLYVPELVALFQLNNTEVSSLYAAATLGSAFLLPWVGRYVDTWPLMRFTSLAIGVLTLALFSLSFAVGAWMVLLGFWGLRFGGQGLMTHTAASAMVRGFEANRGKALSIASLGYPASEAVMPLVVAFAIGMLGWQGALRASGFWLVIVILPLALWLIRSAPSSLKFPKIIIHKDDVETTKTIRNPFRLIRGRIFWILMPVLFLLGFINTALFFFQIQFGESRGWNAGWMAGSISAFAVASAFGMLVSGPLVDRLTARMIFPFFMGLYVVGLVLLAAFQAPVIYPVALLFLGVSNGMSSTIKNAVLAELYGATIIGSVRSFFTMATVFSTALGPIAFGLLTDSGLSYELLFFFSALAVVLAMIWSLQILSRFTRGRWKVMVSLGSKRDR